MLEKDILKKKEIITGLVIVDKQAMVFLFQGKLLLQENSTPQDFQSYNINSGRRDGDGEIDRNRGQFKNGKKE